MPGQDKCLNIPPIADGRKLRVGVIFGGRSGEHEVSLMSAASVLANLDPARYEVVPIGITKEGQWVTAGDPDPRRAMTEGLSAGGPFRRVALLGDPVVDCKLIDVAPAVSHPAAHQAASAPGFSLPASGPLPPLDVVFPVLHGPYGEDGTIQGLLELAGLPYVGAGVLASAVGMDKATMKDIFTRHGLPVLDYVIVKRKDWRREPRACLEKIAGALDFPVFVKPCNLGSSVGITKVHTAAGLGPALDLAARYDRKMIVEKGLSPAREIECSVLGNDFPEASLCGEVIPSREFYDYKAKYIDGTSGLLIPATLPEEVSDRIRDIAVRAFLALDACGMARADFLVSDDGRQVYLNELNTIPGFTKISMYPKLWEASGLPYPRLLDRLIELAYERHADLAQNQTTYLSGQDE
jgi:D-alanine-D-alanine ligase